MKVTANIEWLLFIGLLLIIATYLITEHFNEQVETVSVKPNKNYNVVTFRLPKNPDPEVFGPEYWKAFHTLAEMIPCPACRYKAVPFMKFFHDVVNVHTGKNIFDQENYDYWIDYFNKNK